MSGAHIMHGAEMTSWSAQNTYFIDWHMNQVLPEVFKHWNNNHSIFPYLLSIWYFYTVSAVIRRPYTWRIISRMSAWSDLIFSHSQKSSLFWPLSHGFVKRLWMVVPSLQQFRSQYTQGKPGKRAGVRSIWSTPGVLPRARSGHAWQIVRHSSHHKQKLERTGRYCSEHVLCTDTCAVL